VAGQPDLFLQWQLVFFRSGSRKNEVMQPIAEQLSNEDIRNLGGLFCLTAASCGDKARRIFSSGVGAAKIVGGRSCASCHTDTFAGTKGTARIAGQREDYLVKALHDYNPAQDRAAGWPLWRLSRTLLATMRSVPWHIISRTFSCWREGRLPIRGSTAVF